MSDNHCRSVRGLLDFKVNAIIGILSNSHFCSRELICGDRPSDDKNLLPCEEKKDFPTFSAVIKNCLNPIPLKKDFYNRN